MSILNLKHWGTQQAMRHEALKGLPLIGRGMFCAVFDKGETVLKLTADRIQYGFYTDYTAPTGDHYPRLVENYGEVGEQHEHMLYLIEMEKLTKIGRRADCPDLAWEQRKAIISISEEWRAKHVWKHSHVKNPIHYCRVTDLAVLNAMSKDERLDESMRTVCEELAMFVSDYDAGLDLHRGNFMLRGETLVFNDVMSDIESVCAHKSRRCCH